MAFTRRAVIFAGGALAGAFGTRVWRGEKQSLEGVQSLSLPVEEGYLNDASGLERTRIFKHIVVRDDPNEILLAKLRAELDEARKDGRPVNVGAARHSMGGQSIPRDGHAITFENGLVTPSSDTYRAHAGARWRDVISALEPAGLSPKVMQSNNDFGVAASFSVNVHGWPTAYGPMGSTVRSVEMMLADGSVVTASPGENTELFNAAMGGYGLIGLIIQLEIEAVKNTVVEPHFQVMNASDFAEPFMMAARSSPMAFGRLNVARGEFFEEALLVSFREYPDEPVPPKGSGNEYLLVRSIFRAQTNNEWAKRRRWDIETKFAPYLMGKTSRSTQMNKTVADINGAGDAMRADILHEYFVPPSRFADFIDICKLIIPSSYQDLLNVTLRWVEGDPNSYLSYAPDGPMIAAVMNFGQELTQRAEMDAARMTRELVEAVVAIGGTYYLPYRPHATLDQFRSTYMRAGQFASLKRAADPDLLFRNALWDRYIGQT